MWERVGNDPIPPDKIICAPPCRGLITHTDTHTHEQTCQKMYPYKNRNVLVTLCSMFSFHSTKRTGQATKTDEFSGKIPNGL